MLPYGCHHHFAFQQFPERERRLAYRKNPTGGNGKRDDSQKNTSGPEAEKPAPLESSAPKTAETNLVESYTGQNRKKLLRQVPADLLSQATVGAYYLMDSIANLLGEEELKKLAKKSGVNLKNVGDIDALLADWQSKKKQAGALMDGFLSSPRYIQEFCAYLESQLRQYEKLQTLASGRVDAYTHLPAQTVARLDAKEQQLQLEGRTLDQWFSSASLEVLFADLQIPQPLQKIYANRKEDFVRLLQESQRTKRHLQTWNLGTIERNAELKRLLGKSKQPTALQRELYEKIQASLPLIEDALQQQVLAEAEQTSTWLEHEKETLHKELPLQTESTVDQVDTDWAKAQGATASVIASEAKQIEDTLRFAQEETQTLHAVDAGTMVEHLRAIRQTSQGTERHLPDRAQQEQQIAEAWSQKMTPLLSRILQEEFPTAQDREQFAHTYGLPDLFPQLEQLWEDLSQDTVHADIYTGRRRMRLGQVLLHLSNRRIRESVAAAREAAEQQRTDQQPETEQLISTQVEQTRRRLGAICDTLIEHPMLTSGVCQSLGVSNHLRERKSSLERNLVEIEQGTESPLTSVQAEVQKLEQSWAMLESITVRRFGTTAEFQATSHSKQRAFYDYKTASVWIDEEACGSQLEHILAHERDHAALDIFLRRAAVFPYLLEGSQRIVESTHPEFRATLKQQAETWGYTEQDLEENELLDLLFEEAIVKRADSKRRQAEDPSYDPADEYTPEEVALFALLDQSDLDRALLQHSEPAIRRDDLRLYRSATITPSATPDVEEHETAGPFESQQDPTSVTEPSSGLRDVSRQLDTIDNTLNELEGFAKIYPNYQGDLSRYLPIFRDAHEDLERAFRTRTIQNQRKEHPEEEPSFQEKLIELKKGVDAAKEKVKEIEIRLRDVSSVSKDEDIFARLWGNTIWLSPLDIYKMWNDATEDIKRMWERKSQKKRSQFGSKLFGLFPHSSLPGLEYLGRLGGEFQRRDQQAEIEEVNVWKEAIKDYDANTLLTMTYTIGNSDQGKAIMELLAEKGRLDWDNQGIWTMLNRLSSFTMPFEACKRDKLLRDNWIRKLTNDIWSDRDMYFNLKQKNDSTYKSNRDGYETLVDVYANTGTMPGQLEELLEQFDRAKKSGGIIPPDVNPHMYEKLLEYAMVNGKMSMEDKFFYLIKGIDVGLLPLERLNVLNREVISNFPFIDYFTSHNNSIGEIHALAQSLTEPDNHYKPGIRTKLFLQFKVARDEDTRQRVSKVMERDARNIDHEDVPMMLAFFDYKGWDNMLRPASGQLQRLTPEGLKNVYVGYDTMFKTYGVLAELHEKGIRRFTKEDARNLANKVVAYIHFDNIVTGKANGGQNHPTLSWEQIHNEGFPMGGGNPPQYFRKDLNEFVQDVAGEYFPEEVQIGDKTVPLSDYLPSEEKDQDPRFYDEKKQREVFGVTQQVVREVTNRIQADPSAFMRALRGHMPDFKMDITTDKAIEALQ